jgi:hypothetical protein
MPNLPDWGPSEERSTRMTDVLNPCQWHGFDRGCDLILRDGEPVQIPNAVSKWVGLGGGRLSGGDAGIEWNGDLMSAAHDG